MKVQLEFDLTDRGSRSALRVMIDAIEAIETAEPERRRESSDSVSTGSSAATLSVSSATVGEAVVVAEDGDITTREAERGDIDVDGAKPAPARVNGGDTGDLPEGPIARARRGRKRAEVRVANDNPPQPPAPPPVDGAAPEDVSGPDDETETPHPLGITEGQEGGTRKNGKEDPYLISAKEARETAVKHLKTVWASGIPKAKAEVAQYQKELGLKAFSDCPDDRAHEMYRRSVTMMHAIGKSA